MKESEIGGIYLLINIINNKKYVGKAKNFKKRWKEHVYESKYKRKNTLLYNAMNKYGIDNFIMECLDDEYSNEKEIYWINKICPEYNMTKGGDGGFIHSQKGKKWKVKDTSNMIVANRKSILKRIEKIKDKISGGNNYQCNYIIKTPWGEFETWVETSNKAKELRLQNNLDVITDIETLKKYCKNNIKIGNGKRTPDSFKLKYTKDLGFDFIIKK